jgi:hypothetical protein
VLGRHANSGEVTISFRRLTDEASSDYTQPPSEAHVLKVVTLKEIERIFTVTDGMGISREALMIPLGPKHPGSVKKLTNGKYEIVVDGQAEFETWLGELEGKLRAVM